MREVDVFEEMALYPVDGPRKYLFDITFTKH